MDFLLRRQRMSPFLFVWVLVICSRTLLSHAFLLRDSVSSPNFVPRSPEAPQPQQQQNYASKSHHHHHHRRRRPLASAAHVRLGSHSAHLGGSSTEELVTTAPLRKLRVGIAGAGAIAFGAAALLSEEGHDPMLWSPSGAGTEDLRRNPALSVERNKSGSTHEGATGEWILTPRICTSAQELVEQNDVLMIALPANGHKQVFDAIAPHVRNGQPIIISSHSSFGALYLAQLLRDYLGDNAVVPITAWGTTVCTARRPSGTSVRVNTVRQSVDLCTIPHSESQTSLELCQCLFPQVETFRAREGLLAISLSNLNPQNHLGIALGNISRMEKGEAWYQSENITPTIGLLLESLDKERLAIAEALHLETKTIFEHFSLSFHVPITSSIADMNQEIHKAGNDVYGPNTANSRYITEDIPFGLVPTIVLGDMVNRPATLHQSGVHIVSAMYGRDFVAENDLLPALHLERYSLEELQEAALTGALKQSTVVQ